MVQQINGTTDEVRRPSSERRTKLKMDDENSGSIPTVSNFFPIERYYDASDKVLLSFESAFENKMLDDAFVYGMRYCRFCMEGITKHDYYNAQKYIARKREMGIRVTDVIGKLEKVADLMDIEETKKEEERRRQKRLEEERRLAEFNKKMAQLKSSSGVSTDTVEQSALAKLNRLRGPQVQERPNLLLPDKGPDQNKKVSWNLPAEPDGQLLSQFSYDAGDLPPPLAPPSSDDGGRRAPPSYNSILKQSYFGPGKVAPLPTQPSAPSYDQAAKMSKKKQKLLPIRQLKDHAKAMYQRLQMEGKIQISSLRTYQGRISGSTNGCTVISALCASRHIETNGGITDQQIMSVIDKDCIPLLRAIRSKLGIGGSSLIIPSDVHDHFVDHKLLHQHKFVDVIGGNIIDPEKSGEFIEKLRGEPGKTSHLKASATLFFKDHVVSIVKYPTSANDAVYDMIDSLPTCKGQGSRTRCHGVDALRICLSHYATRKLWDKDIAYIESNDFEESMADFDPRTFQGFVWADLPKPT